LWIPTLLFQLDQPDSAKTYLEKHRSLAVADSLFFTLAWTYAKLEDQAQTRYWLESLEKAREFPLTNLAQVATMIGDLDLAFDYLGRAYEKREFALTRLATSVENSVDWRPLATDPRYHELVRRLGLRD
jgi:hypothetical protein